MLVIVVCALLMLVGLIAVGHRPRHLPTVGLVGRCYLWYVTWRWRPGVGAGVMAAGAGGRLVRRLLPVTADDDASAA
jgi:hypothetical protein